MKYIKPRLIAGNIMTLMEETKEKLIIVSPYNDFTGWNKLKNVLHSVLQKDITFEYFIRADHNQSITVLNEMDIHPILVPNLHAKLYFNESKGIASSMNLYKGSDDRSLDIAFETETRKELEFLFSFYDTYLKEYINAPQKAESFDLPDDINNIYDTIAYLIDINLPNYKIRYREKSQGVYEYLLGKTNFILEWQYINNQVGISIYMILPEVLYDFLNSFESEFINKFGDSFELTDPGGNRYCYLGFYMPLPERKLNYCTRKQIYHISMKITDVIISVIKKLESSKEEKILSCLRYPY